MVHQYSWLNQTESGPIWKFASDILTAGRSEFQGSATIWRWWGNSTGGSCFSLLTAKAAPKKWNFSFAVSTDLHAAQTIFKRYGYIWPCSRLVRITGSGKFHNILALLAVFVQMIAATRTLTPVPCCWTRPDSWSSWLDYRWLDGSTCHMAIGWCPQAWQLHWLRWSNLVTRQSRSLGA